MWTCGIDMATQQAMPAMHNSAISAFEDTPRVPSLLAAAQQQRERYQHDDTEDANPDLSGAPAVGRNEMLDDGWPDGARKIIAARCNRHRDAAAAQKPMRHVGHQRTERRGAAKAEQALCQRERPDAAGDSRECIASAERDSTEHQRGD